LVKRLPGDLRSKIRITQEKESGKDLEFSGMGKFQRKGLLERGRKKGAGKRRGRDVGTSLRGKIIKSRD